MEELIKLVKNISKKPEVKRLVDLRIKGISLKKNKTSE